MRPLSRIASALLVAAALFAGAPVAAQTNANVPFTPVVPEPAVYIPGYTGFSTLQVQDAGGSRFLDIPFLAEYIVVVYRYALGIIVTLATVMVVVGGLRWTLAAGDAGRVGQAKETILRAVMGLLIAFGSYAILAVINPELVSFRNIRLNLIQRQETVNVENGGFADASGAETTGGGSITCRNGSTVARPVRQSMTFTGFDPLFQQYAGCTGVDWRILKAVAYTESHFDAHVVNCFGFTGLFQIGSGTNLDRRAQLRDPAYNTYLAASHYLHDGAQLLSNTCPGMTDAHRYTMLLYFGHNSGVGALRRVLASAGCNATDDQYRQAAADFWASTGRDIPNAAGRMNVARLVADRAVELGVTSPLAAGSCPSAPTPSVTDIENVPTGL